MHYTLLGAAVGCDSFNRGAILSENVAINTITDIAKHNALVQTSVLFPKICKVL